MEVTFMYPLREYNTLLQAHLNSIFRRDVVVRWKVVNYILYVTTLVLGNKKEMKKAYTSFHAYVLSKIGTIPSYYKR